MLRFSRLALRLDRVLAALWWIFVCIALLAVLSGPARAQGTRNCAPRDVVVARLSDGYGESRQSLGLGAEGALIEVFASQDTGTWTITVTNPGGLTCLVASGQSYESLTEALPTQGDDT